jgi:hypothetical protein
MKSVFTLRFLCIISFLLLFCPFYDSCNGNGLKKAETKSEKPIIESESFLDKTIDFFDDGDSQNAIEIATMSFILVKNIPDLFNNGIIKSIKDNDYKNNFYVIRHFSFLIIVMLTFVNLVLSFTKKLKFVFKFSKWILILLLISIVCLFFDGDFEEISQIKWGYYTFTFVVIGVLFYGRQLLKPRLP